MSNEHQQPLHEQPPRSSDDQKLVSKVLGEEAAAEMVELTGDPIKTSTPQPSNLELSKTEATKIKSRELKGIQDRRRAEYIEWAKKIDCDKDWVQRNFQFNEDGTVEYMSNLVQRFYSEINSFPDSLTVIRGYLDLRGCLWDKAAFERLEGMVIGGKLMINISDYDKLPKNIYCTGIIILEDLSQFNQSNDMISEHLEQKGYTIVIFKK